MRFTATEIAQILDGELVGPDQEVRDVSIDSRALNPGSLFVPIVAERDGHDFIASALENGATCFLTARADLVPSSEASANDAVAGIVVNDTGAALTKLGVAARTRLPDLVIGVTGSVGKTSVKDLVAAACGAGARTHANVASFNNELGLPLTLGNAPEDTQITVLEMGARGAGHVAELCQIGRPTIGIVTRVAGAHVELFGSLEGVAKAKGELIEALPNNGVAVLNADDPLVMGMAERASCPVVTFGQDAGDYRVTNLELDEALCPTFELQTPSGVRSVRLGVAGAHMAVNAAAALAASVAAGIDLDVAIGGIESATISGLRMDITTRSDGLVIINDAYNANPTSVRAAFAGLLALDAETRIAVLGVMAELGPDSVQLHRDIAEEAVEAGFRVIAVDAADYGPGVEHVGDLSQANDLLAGVAPSTTAVLVKGSRVAELERLANLLIDNDGGVVQEACDGGEAR